MMKRTLGLLATCSLLTLSAGCAPAPTESLLRRGDWSDIGTLLVGAVDEAGVLSSYSTSNEDGPLVVAVREHIEGSPRVHPDWELEFTESFLPAIRAAFGSERTVVFLRQAERGEDVAGAGCAPIEPQLCLSFDFDFTESAEGATRSGQYRVSMSVADARSGETLFHYQTRVAKRSTEG